MKVNVMYFIYGGVLGITDIDVCCNREKGSHHEEVIMGYGVLINRMPNATYKDIAGVSIRRTPSFNR